ncbi:MAG: hypothetical protein ABI946_00470 [Chthoniobacterales bacterium]
MVNSTAETPDVAPGDGTCADGEGACSLRAAITKSNALAGADVVTIIQAGTTVQSATERVIHCLGGATLILNDLTVRNGNSISGSSGGDGTT